MPDESQDAVTSIFCSTNAEGTPHCFSRMCPGAEARRASGPRDSLQRGDQPDYEGLLELFPQSYHEPYYRSYTNEDFGTLAAGCGLTHIRDVTAFVSKVMVFDKPAVRVREKK